MKKLKMATTAYISFKEGCEKYLLDCRQRNLREGTIRHYKQIFNYFYKNFNSKTSKNWFVKIYSVPNKLRLNIYKILILFTYYFNIQNIH